jgi:hypothetical protein
MFKIKTNHIQKESRMNKKIFALALLCTFHITSVHTKQAKNLRFNQVKKWVSGAVESIKDAFDDAGKWVKNGMHHHKTAKHLEVKVQKHTQDKSAHQSAKTYKNKAKSHLKDARAAQDKHSKLLHNAAKGIAAKNNKMTKKTNDLSKLAQKTAQAMDGKAREEALKGNVKSQGFFKSLGKDLRSVAKDATGDVIADKI